MNCFKALLIVAFLLPPAWSQNGGRPEAGTRQRPVPTHSDAALIFAKYTGFFSRYVDDAATLGECVSFLNDKGIYFGLLEIVNGAEFTQQDCARAMAQMDLLFSGDASFSHGKVALPDGMASWQEYCQLNGIAYVQAYENLVATLVELQKIKSVD